VLKKDTYEVDDQVTKDLRKKLKKSKVDKKKSHKK
jgi:hypothetical protein